MAEFLIKYAVDYKIVLGIIATIIGFISYLPYFRDIFRGKTKPHAFSWLIWGVDGAIIFAGQIVGGGGPGTWVLGLTSVMCLLIFVTALTKGKRNIVLADWLSLFGAAIALVIWYFTKDPLMSIILITTIDILGFIPTFRKSYHKPHEETLITYSLSIFKFGFSVAALTNITLITAIYPITFIFMNIIFTYMILTRKKTLA
jgi:hypothetical protein